jgi:hypothetical protein
MMAASWHDNGLPSFIGAVPSFSFYELAEAHQEAPSPYQVAMREIKIREAMLGEEWFRHNAELAHTFFKMKLPWYL